MVKSVNDQKILDIKSKSESLSSRIQVLQEKN